MSLKTKLASIACSLVLFTSCVDSSTTSSLETATSTTTVKPVNQFAIAKQKREQRMLKLRLESKARIEAYQARIRALQNPQKRSAALNIPAQPPVKAKPKPKVKKASVGGAVRSSGSITQNASLKCVPKRLRSVVYQVARKFGHVTVNSTYRSRSKNRRVGGARSSYHLRCQAVDFRVHGNNRGLFRYLRNHPSVGGLKRYRSGYYHIDTGPRRTW